ncbi:MAG TPA: outer membrane protein transport protein [Steroidobacter sp.]|nr:outer membrane protein transport protein [Steroidobacter sp.]
MRNFQRQGALLALAASPAVIPSLANASGFALLEQSGSRLGTAFSGTTAAADDATTNYFNPAGLSRLQRPELIVIASGVGLSSEFDDQGSQAAFLQTLGGTGGDAGDWNFVPSAYVAWPINTKFALGFGVNAPFGLVTEYDAGWEGRFQALRSEIKTYNFNPSLSWRVNDGFSIGVGVSYQRLDAELTSSVNYSGVVAQAVQQLVAAGQLPPVLAPSIIAANTGLEGEARVRGDDSDWGFNIGLLFEPTQTTRIGLAYRSSIEYTVSGTVQFSEPTAANLVGRGIVAIVSAPGSVLGDGPVSVDVEVPESAIASLRQAFGRFALLADVGWTAWSSVEELRIVRDEGAVVSVTPERWDDAWRFALGGEYEFSDAFLLRAGIARDDSAVPDETRTPRLPDAQRDWIAIGARWRPSQSMAFDFGYAHLFSDDVPLNPPANGAANGVLIGEQESYVDVVSAQFTYRF